MNKLITAFLAFFISGIVFGQDVPSSISLKEDSLKDIAIITICYDYPDHDALFLNGKEDFAEKLKSKISTDGLKMLKGEKNFKSNLSFIVDRDGTISEILVSGTNKKFNNVVKLAAKQIKGKWVPARKNGDFVKTKIRIPIVMNFH